MALGSTGFGTGDPIMPIPEITHLQFLLLVSLLDGDQAGRKLREILEQNGKKLSGPAFYQLMARLEDSRFVKGRYETKVIDGQTIKERWYEITGAGQQVCRDVREFYAQNLRLGTRFASA